MRTKIAVVDDSQLALAWMKQSLQEQGYDVVTYQSAIGIQNFIKREQPTIVLLDVNMPALNGNLVCSMVKKNDKTSGILIVLHSSMPRDELSQMASDCAADGYITKTDDINQLCMQIEKFIMKSQAG